jgi:glutamate dehydrogenase/leucine dehydrogenase
MGTDNADIRTMLETVGVDIRVRDGYGIQTGLYTAMTVFVGAREAMRHLGRDLTGRSVAIEGFGKVGAPLANLLSEAGARVVAISTTRGAIYNPQGLDVGRLANLASEAGSRVVDLCQEAQRIDLGTLLELPVDLLCPCARHDSIQEGNASRIAAAAVCPGANNPVTPGAERMLTSRGVICLPDFVTNSGGVLGGRMEFASLGQRQIGSFIERRIGPILRSMLGEARRRGVAPREIAVPYALRRFERMRQEASHPSLRNRVFQMGLEAYRRGVVPRAAVRALSLAYFDRILS